MITLLSHLSVLAIGIYIGETIAERHEKKHIDRILAAIDKYFSEVGK